MKSICNKLITKDGNVGFVAIVIILMFMLLMVAVTQMIKPFMIVSTVNGALQQASNDVATQNSYSLYNGVREGNNAAAEYGGNKWNTASLNTAVIGRLKQLLKLSSNGSTHEQIDDKGLVAYRITDVSVSCISPSVRSSANFKIVTSLTLHIPLRIGEQEPITTVKVPIKIRTKYTQLY